MTKNYRRPDLLQVLQVGGTWQSYTLVDLEDELGWKRQEIEATLRRYKRSGKVTEDEGVYSITDRGQQFLKTYIMVEEGVKRLNNKKK